MGRDKIVLKVRYFKFQKEKESQHWAIIASFAGFLYNPVTFAAGRCPRCESSARISKHSVKYSWCTCARASCDCQFSVSLSRHNFFDHENRLRFPDFTAIFSDYAENLSRVLRAAGFFDSALFELSIKEPLVDLDPSEAGLWHGFLADLAVQFPVMFLVEVGEDLDLVVCFALTVGISLIACWSFLLLAKAFAWNLNIIRVGPWGWGF